MKWKPLLTAPIISFTVLVVITWLLHAKADPPANSKRIPWTSSRITGSPEPPPPYQSERVFPKLSFTHPVTIARAPGCDRLFVLELGGKIFSFPDDQACATPDLFLDVGKVPGHYRTYGVAFHPQFAKNHYVYICYVQKDSQHGSKVSRFKVKEGTPPQADPASETVLLDWPAGGHNGGCLQFGPDGYLYISTGDGSNPSPPDARDTGQYIGDLLASILRIDVDRSAGDKPYAIPPDNPFIKLEDACPEVWAYGFRNPWKMSFDPKSGELWVGDVGWEMWEMIYRVERGGNYGWAVVEGRQPVRGELKRGPTPIIPPAVDHDHTESRSITGGRVYRGQRLKELTGAYIYGDYVTGKLWGLRSDGKKITWKQELAHSAIEIIDFGEGNDGELYILDYGGGLFRLAPNPSAQANPNFPRRLSETGLFASVRDHVPAPGVIPYTINAEPWADHAEAERLFAAPGSGTLGLYDKQNLQAGIVKGAWIYPNDTVFAKTMTLALERGNPASRRRLETQILHQDRGTWKAYTYLWNDEQTDAVLADSDGRDLTLPVKEAGQSSKQAWHIASRTECLVCHTTRAGSILGFNPSQLNRDNQLQALKSLDLFEKPLPEPLPRLPNPWDTKESVQERALGYLHTNCAHCHRRGGGGTAPFELVYGLDLKKALLIGTRPTQGTFEIHAAENVSPGDPYRSVLWYRMAKLGSGHMPYAGSNVIDEKGLELIHEWIRQLPAIPGSRPSVRDEQQALLTAVRASADAATRAQAIQQLLGSTSGALYLLHALDAGQLPDAVRRQVIDMGAKHSAAQVRDLFERFIPFDQRVQRLGTAIKPAAILALRGDVSRGQQLFFKTAGTQCRNCHRIGKEGQEVGPDLTLIGKKLDRPQLLESILEPSKTIDPAFVTYVAETTAGMVISGLLVRKTDQEVVLKDAQGKVVTIPAMEIETLAPQSKSLMPELQLRDLTAQEVADLLDYLASLR